MEAFCIVNSHYGKLPDGWEICLLSELWTLISGRDLTPSEYTDNETGIPYITGASNFKNGDLTISRWTDCPKVVAKSGDLFLTCKGTVGELYINDKGDVHIARQIMAIRNEFNFNVEFLKFTLLHHVSQIVNSAKGIIPGISREDVLNLDIPFPPLEEQKRIVTAIEATLEQIEKIAENLS
jgi:type I restriction enzyme S subunit